MLLKRKRQVNTATAEESIIALSSRFEVLTQKLAQLEAEKVALRRELTTVLQGLRPEDFSGLEVDESLLTEFGKLLNVDDVLQLSEATPLRTALGKLARLVRLLISLRSVGVWDININAVLRIAEPSLSDALKATKAALDRRLALANAQAEALLRSWIAQHRARPDFEVLKTLLQRTPREPVRSEAEAAALCDLKQLTATQAVEQCSQFVPRKIAEAVQQLKKVRYLYEKLQALGAAQIVAMATRFLLQ